MDYTARTAGPIFSLAPRRRSGERVGVRGCLLSPILRTPQCDSFSSIVSEKSARALKRAKALVFKSAQSALAGKNDSLPASHRMVVGDGFEPSKA